jgi:hypothetical protein
LINLTMRILKTIVAAIAWISIIWFIFGILELSSQVISSIRFPIVYTPGMIIERAAFGWVIISGVVLALIAGFIAKPRFMWPVLVVSGTICSILALIQFSYEYSIPASFSVFVWYLICGIVCISEGLLLRWFRIKQKAKADIQS